jgi:cell division septation protein DedD
MGIRNKNLPTEDAEAAEAFEDAQAEELDLGADEERLPWLEGDDDADEPGVDTARVAAFGVIGLLAVILVVGGIWWGTHGHFAGGPKPDGSTIAAPAGPYKTKPADPGGKTFVGTGDESFAVAEGKSREGVLATDNAPQSSVDPTAAATASAPAASAPAKPAAAPTPEAKGVGVQVGAYSNRATAEAGWSKLVTQLPALHGVSHRIVEGRADIGTVYRLQAVAPDVAEANSLCAKLKASGGACQVKP